MTVAACCPEWMTGHSFSPHFWRSLCDGRGITPREAVEMGSKRDEAIEAWKVAYNDGDALKDAVMKALRARGLG